MIGCARIQRSAVTVCDRSMFFAVRAYARVQYFCHERLRLNVRGLGFGLRLLRSKRVLNVKGIRLLFEPSIAGSYARLVAGLWNEPETHEFLQKIARGAPSRMIVIDVGANIGEMALDAARLSSVEHVWAVEPFPSCARVVVESARLNGFHHLEVLPLALSDAAAPASLLVDWRNPALSRLLLDGQSILGRAAGEETLEIVTSTLDQEFATISHPTSVLIIDVEGAELAVMRGGRSFIRRNHPLIIFEYNAITRRRVQLSDVEAELPSEYEIFRLRRDGFLDRRLERTWNCVAVDRASADWAFVGGLVRC